MEWETGTDIIEGGADLMGKAEGMVSIRLSHTLLTDIEYELEKLNRPKLTTFGKLLQIIKDTLN